MNTETSRGELVRWGPKDGLEAGITINSVKENFIPWEKLKKEIETKLLIQVRVVPAGSKVELGELFGRKDWIVKIISPEGEEIGHVWFGVDPDSEWKEDGLIRLGKPNANDKKTVVWQIFQRHSDDTYHRIKSNI